MKEFRSSDGSVWLVEVLLPGASNALVAFRHSDGRMARKDRYNWYNAAVPGATDVKSRLDAREIERSLGHDEMARLFRRSMPISAAGNPLGFPVAAPG